MNATISFGELRGSNIRVNNFWYNLHEMDLQSTTTVIPLHHNWEYLDACCNLLNEEWPRSMTARMHGLKASCDNFPTSLLLLSLESGSADEELVLAHSKISSMHNYPSACFVESVVVTQKFRGKGLGRHIMLKTEEYVRRKGKSIIFLTTTDQEEFYAKLGYDKCEPVSIYGCKSFQTKNVNHSKPLNTETSNSHGPLERPPPVPPPPPPSKKPIATKIYMMKILV